MTLINVDNPLHMPPIIMDPNCENCLYSNIVRAEYLKSVWHTKLGFLEDNRSWTGRSKGKKKKKSKSTVNDNDIWRGAWIML